MDYKEIKEKHNWNMPETCPICGKSSLKLLSNGTIICSNPLCRGKLSHQIARMFSALNVKGAGEAMIEKITNDSSGIINLLKDAFNYTDSSTLANKWNKWAESINGEKVLKSFSSKIKEPISLSKFLGILDYEGFDEKKLKVFDKYSLDEFLNLNYNKIINENGFAEISTNKILNMIKECRDEITNLAPFFVFKGNETCKEKSSKGSVCFTGAGPLPRKDLETKSKEKGFEVKDSVTKDLSLLVMADPNSSSSKAVKARMLGVKVMSYEEFISNELN